MTDWKTVTVNGVAFKRRVAFGRSAETLRAVKTYRRWPSSSRSPTAPRIAAGDLVSRPSFLYRWNKTSPGSFVFLWPYA